VVQFRLLGGVLGGDLAFPFTPNSHIAVWAFLVCHHLAPRFFHGCWRGSFSALTEAPFSPPPLARLAGFPDPGSQNRPVFRAIEGSCSFYSRLLGEPLFSPNIRALAPKSLLTFSPPWSSPWTHTAPQSSHRTLDFPISCSLSPHLFLSSVAHVVFPLPFFNHLTQARVGIPASFW